MAGSTNFKQWNPALANIQSDAAYEADTMRSGGAIDGVYEPELHNKFAYQVSAMVAAIAQSLAAKGFVVEDGSAGTTGHNFSALVAVLANILTTADAIDADTLNGHASSVTPGAGIIPVAGPGGKIDSGFLAKVALDPIFDHTVDSAVTTLPTEDILDINTDKGYNFEFLLKNGYAGDTTFRLFYNGDTTTSKYSSNWQGTSVQNDAFLYAGAAPGPIGIGESLNLTGSILLTPEGYPRIVGIGQRFTSGNVVSQLSLFSHMMNTVLDGSPKNLLSLLFSANQTGGIDVNSRFRIWIRQ